MLPWTMPGEVVRAFKRTTRPRAVIVDLAQAVVAEEDAPPVAVGEDALQQRASVVAGDGQIDRPGCEPAPLVFPLQQYGIRVAILAAARGVAAIAGARADDGKSHGHER